MIASNRSGRMSGISNQSKYGIVGKSKGKESKSKCFKFGNNINYTFESNRNKLVLNRNDKTSEI